MTNEPQSEATTDLRFLSIRLLALGAFIFLVNAWITTNLSEHLVKALVANGILAVLSLVGTLMKYLDDRRAKSSASQVQGMLLFFLRTPVLLTLYFAFLIVGSLFASVSVSSDGLAVSAAVRLTAAGDSTSQPRSKRIDRTTTMARFLEWTTPFGRPFSLSVDGFVPISFDLHPWVGKRVSVASDMVQSPSLLIRVPPEFSEQVNEARITLASDTAVLATCKMDAEHWAVLVGESQPAYATFLDKWLLEFKARRIPEELASRCLLAWNEPLLTKSSAPLLPNLHLQATLCNKHDILLATRKFIVSSDKIQDIVFK
jgi:hypothetical protein